MLLAVNGTTAIKTEFRERKFLGRINIYVIHVGILRIHHNGPIRREQGRQIRRPNHNRVFQSLRVKNLLCAPFSANHVRSRQVRPNKIYYDLLIEQLE